MNRRLIQKVFAGGLAVILFFGVFGGFQKAEADQTPALNVYAAGAILVDGQTGRILYTQNPDKLLGIASMSKMMTEYMLLDAIKNGRVNWNETYTVDSKVYKISQNRSLSNVPLRMGGTYTVKELYQAMAIYSANAATIALADIMGGSETNFVQMMNAEAKKMGLQDYKFVNCTGLNNADYQGMQPTGTATEENEMSPRTVATLAFRLIHDFPEVLQTSSIPTMMFMPGTSDQIRMDNWDWMLPGLVYGYQGMQGLKTGTTNFAGYCFTGTAIRNGERFITVVQNATNASGQGGYQARFDETRKMMDYAFSNYANTQIVPEHYQVKGQSTIKVLNGKSTQVEVYTSAPLNMIIPNGEEQNYKTVLVLDKSKLNKDGELTAPIKKGETVGYLTVESKNGGKLNFLTSDGPKILSVNVVAAQDDAKANWFILTMRSIGGFFGGLFSGIGSTVKGWF